ncbi:axin-related protein-like [Latimeria chalumnae]|uniref:axin-related protein-like n=1 Tax=Latimeria chalumnae TaxID=7897 RepID=UPI00313C7545
MHPKKSMAGMFTHLSDSGFAFRECDPRPPVLGQENQSLKMTQLSKELLEPDWTPQRKDSELGEPEGCATPDRRLSRWSRSLHALLEDRDGEQLFRVYLEGEEVVDLLDFWFACSGFRQMSASDAKTPRVAKAIYRWYIQNSEAVSSRLKPATQAYIKDVLKQQQYDLELFDQAQLEIQRAMEGEAYPAFLKSQLCQEYTRVGMESPGRLIAHSPTWEGIKTELHLPTLAEEEEESGTVSRQCGKMRVMTDIIRGASVRNKHSRGRGDPIVINNDPLQRIKIKRREQSRERQLIDSSCEELEVPVHNSTPPPKFELYFPGFTRTDWCYFPTAGCVFCRTFSRKVDSQVSLAPATSANDSEISSDALTDDTLSVAESSIDGCPPYWSDKKQVQREIHRSVSANGHIPLPFIPRMMRPPSEMIPMKPAEFAAKLITALERVKRQQQAEEELEEKLQCLKADEENVECETPAASREPALALPLASEDDPQSILDNHLSRVLKTPAARSPGTQSPSVQQKAKGHGAYLRGHATSVERSKCSEHAQMKLWPSETHTTSSSRKPDHVGHHWPKEEGPVMEFPPVADSEAERVQSIWQWVLDSAKLAKRYQKEGQSSGTEMKKSSHRPSFQPSHPYVQDTSMPPLAAPNTLVQLEEARRRLVEEKRMPKFHKARCVQSTLTRDRNRGQDTVTGPVVVPGRTLEEHKQAKKPNVEGYSAGGLVVAYYFCGERIPYMIRTKEQRLTLREFKELLSKKGIFKYYFKKASNEFECKAVFQEISKEDSILPLYGDKIICKVERIG